MAAPSTPRSRPSYNKRVLNDLDDDAAGVVAAAVAAAGPEDVLAVRGTDVWAGRLTADPVPQEPRPWTPSGTVLVTGGLGAVGRHVARWLARSGAEHLVLLGRGGERGEAAAELRAELGALGVGVSVHACDVADHDALAAVVAAERAEGRTVAAVFHAAGTSTTTPVVALEPAELRRVAAAKVQGTLNLADLCDEASTLVLFSSNAGVWGSPGLGAYAAANAFLDGFARSRRGTGVTSVAWGLWAGETMAGVEGNTYLKGQGVRAILDRLAPAAPKAPQAADAPAADLLVGATTPEERRRRLEVVVHREVVGVLGLDEHAAVDRHVAFRDLGFDSMTAVELRNRLAEVTGLREGVTVVFDHPTVHRLAQHYLDRLREGSADEVAQTPGPLGVPSAPSTEEDPIVIVGMACRLAGGVRTPEDLWDLVARGGDAVTDIPTDRGWDPDLLAGIAETSEAETMRGAFLDGAADFDAAFFGISPREALAMDPQQRQVLETTWELFENSGIDPRSLRGTRTGIFLGAAYQGYGRDADVPQEAEGYLLTGGSSAVVSGRVAYVLGLEGPAITVDTACSSSLVALHLAVG
uniref:type I polyketide synthase n=1 Tax=Aeromicrobium sp. REDSEA-S32_B7 TaxID=1811526 RepID=UPI0029545923